MAKDAEREAAHDEPRSTIRGLGVDRADPATRAFLSAARGLERYHRHRVFHLDRIAQLMEEGRRVVLVGNHALDIVDPLLFCAKLFERTGRAPHFIGHENGWFRVPVLRDISSHFGIIPSRRLDETVEAVRRDGLLMLFPGANREAVLRRYRDEPYRLKWQERTGFLRVALEADAEVVFVAAVGIDEAYYQSNLPTPRALIRWVNGGDDQRYRGARLGFGLMGAHLVPGLFPLPVRITHAVSRPLDLGDRERARRDPAVFDALHARVWSESQTFLDGAVAARERHSDTLDRVVRAAHGWLQEIGI